MFPCYHLEDWIKYGRINRLILWRDYLVSESYVFYGNGPSAWLYVHMIHECTKRRGLGDDHG